MKYVYLLFILIILYLLYCYYKKYDDQENFDPSLVPVSSIVTLAKVAQKLVDGGGTLTNPGNLQIGLPNAGTLGNLYVTGTNTVDGVSTFNNPVTVNGTTAFTGDNTLTGAQIVNGTSNVNGNLTATTVTSNQYNDSSNNPRIQLFTDGINYYNSGSGNLHRFRGNGGSQAGGNVLVDQDLTVTGNSTVNGTLTVNNTTTLKNNISFVPPSSSTNQSYTLYTAGDNTGGGVVSNSLDMHTYQNGGWRTHALSVGNDGNVNLYNNLNVAGNICIQGTCLSDPYSIKLLLQPVIRRGATNDRVARSPYIVSDIYPCALIDGNDGGNQHLFHMKVGEYVNLMNPNCLDVWRDSTWRLGSSWPDSVTVPNSFDAVNNEDSGLQYVGRGYFSVINASEPDYIVLKSGYTCYFGKNCYSYGIGALITYVGNGTFTGLNSISDGLVNNVRYMKIVKNS